MNEETRAALRRLPKMDEVLGLLEKEGIFAGTHREIVKFLVREAVEARRRQIVAGECQVQGKEELREQMLKTVRETISSLHRRSLRRVVNATGIILHTNLGRAP
ncbi:MAG: L-seryl-tRNA(Sec) selenium transferase, partial [Syntrophales bacterium]|nr:L-seryl-tRNA(Sec) selenium transferase [Syntrophales bacterium]